MSDPREVVGRWYATGDPALLTDDVRFNILATFPEGGTWIGKDDIVGEFLPNLRSHFRTYAARPERMFADGPYVIVLGTYVGTTPGGTEMSSAFAHVWTVREGKIAILDQVADTTAIRHALALV